MGTHLPAGDDLDVPKQLLDQGIERLLGEPALVPDLDAMRVDLPVDVPRGEYGVRGRPDRRSNGSIGCEGRNDVRVDDEPRSRRVGSGALPTS
jgi:hypothetical protein